MQTRAHRQTASRRHILKGAVGLATLALVPRAQAESASPPLVWRDYTQQALDEAYSQGNWAPQWEPIWERYVTNSDSARTRIGEPRNFRYGDGDDETLDVYSPGTTDGPVHVFVHGGAWFTGDARRHGFLAEPFVNAGGHFVAINYASVDDTGGSLLPLADQVRRAVGWVYANARRFGGDNRRIYLSGHSAGAHLAGVALTTDWKAALGLPQDVVKGALLCSGMYDLEPVSLSARRNYVDFDERTLEQLSPQRHIERLNAPLIIAYGSLESPEFQRQSRDFAAAVRDAGKPAELLVAEHYNHFEIIETMANPYGILGHAALQQMGLHS